MRRYDIRLSATIEIGGVFEANSAEEARAAAEMELRPRGEISGLIVERAIYLDDEDPPSEAYDPQPGPGF